MATRKQRIRAAGLIQFGPGLRPEKTVSYDDYNTGTGPQPVVCARCAEGPAAVPSVRDVCTQCLAAVWVSQVTDLAMTQMRQPVLLCFPCAMEDAHASAPHP